jgi:NADH dehydrogenase
MTSKRFRFDVVIAGGGFAGVYCARALAQRLGAEARARVALIADHNFMTFQPMLAEVCGSSISPRHVVNPIRRICRGVTVLRGAITSIDLDPRELRLNAGSFTRDVPVEFDHLVLGLGSIVDLSRVPGMPEHAYLMKNVGDAMELRGTLIDRMEEANVETDPARVEKLLTFVIVGGGFSGVETAGQIQDLLSGIRRFYPGITQPHRVVLVHSGARLLPEVSASLGEYTARVLRERGVEVILGARVSSMTATRILLGEGRSLETHTVVSTVGNAAHPLLVDLCARHSLNAFKGRIITDPTMQVRGAERLWAAGDCAAVPMAGTEKSYCPPTAQFAFRQGELLGKNLARALRGGAAKPFRFRGMGELAAIGHRSAVAEIFGMKFRGFPAWFMWRTIYLTKLPGLERKLRVMIDWTLDLFFPRDITLLRGRPTEILQEMHLEKGDTVFHAGEPAFSFYIVQSGTIELADSEGVVKTLGAGEHFGERALLHDKIWRFTATAQEPTTLVALDGKVFATIDRASSSIHRFFVQSSSQYVTREQIEALVATIPPEVHTLLVRDVMSRVPVTLTGQMTVDDALQVVLKHPYNSFPLVDATGRALGVISQTQLYDALKNGMATPATSLDALDPIRLPTLVDTAPVPEAVERFCRSGRHKLLIVNEAGQLAGILTPIDLMTRRQPAG